MLRLIENAVIELKPAQVTADVVAFFYLLGDLLKGNYRLTHIDNLIYRGKRLRRGADQIAADTPRLKPMFFLNIYAGVFGVLLNKFPPRGNFIAHEHGEQVIRFGSGFNADEFERPSRGIHGSRP